MQVSRKYFLAFARPMSPDHGRPPILKLCQFRASALIFHNRYAGGLASRKANRGLQENKRKEAGLEWMNLAPERPAAPAQDDALRLEPEVCCRLSRLI